MLDIDATALAAGMGAFGEQVAWRPVVGAGATVPAIFFNHARVEDFQDGVEAQRIMPLLSARLSSFGRLPAQGDGFTVRGVAYVATDVSPDGAGALRILLRFANDAQAAVTPTAPTPVVP